MSGRKPDPEPDVHPSADLTARHLGDQKLRHHGFRIVSRPPNGVPLWTRDGVVYTDRDAHETRRAEIEAVTTKRGKRK